MPAAGMAAKAAGESASRKATVTPGQTFALNAATCAAVSPPTTEVESDVTYGSAPSCAAVRALISAVVIPATVDDASWATPAAGIAASAAGARAAIQAGLANDQLTEIERICVAVNPATAAGGNHSGCVIAATCAVVSAAMLAAVALWYCALVQVAGLVGSVIGGPLSTTAALSRPPRLRRLEPCRDGCRQPANETV